MFGLRAHGAHKMEDQQPREGEPQAQGDEKRPASVRPDDSCCTFRPGADRPGVQSAGLAVDEAGNIAALRNVDDDAVVNAVGEVIVLEIATQSCGLDAHDRVLLRIEAFGPAEHDGADAVGLDACTATGKRFVHEVVEQFAGPLRRRKSGTC